jgi:cohesin complex subunit SA-1/2
MLSSVPEVTDESSLFFLVKTCKDPSGIINDWIAEYERHPDNALVQLQQFFISCSGCKGVVSAAMVQSMEYR